MAYASIHQHRRNLPTLAAVAALHVGLGIALINGLAGPLIFPKKDQPLDGYQIENRNEPKPTPEPTVQPTEQPTSTSPRKSDRPDQQVDTAPNPHATGGPELPPTSGDPARSDPLPPIAIPTTPPAFTPVAAVPRGDPGSWVSRADYPAREEREGREGVTRVKLAIGTNGRVTQCELLRTSGWPALDAATCSKITSRARFEPATDEQGARVIGSFTTSVRWQIPEE